MKIVAGLFVLYIRVMRMIHLQVNKGLIDEERLKVKDYPKTLSPRKTKE